MGLLGRLTDWETHISLITKAGTSDILSQLKKSSHSLLVPCGTTFFTKPSEKCKKLATPTGVESCWLRFGELLRTLLHHDFCGFCEDNALLHQRFPRRKTAPFVTRLLPRPLPDSVTRPVQAELNPHAGSAPLVFLTDTFSGEILCGGDVGRGHPSRNDVSVFRCVLNIPRWCGDVEPHMGINIILYDPLSIIVPQSQIEPGIGTPLFGSKSEPLLAPWSISWKLIFFL